MANVKLAVIGAKGRGAYLAQMYNRPPDVKVIAIADKNPDAFEQGRERLDKGGCDYRPYTDVDAMLAKENPDWVFIASPDRTHYELTMKSLRTGCNVFVEKPMCQTIEESDEVCRAARKLNRHVVVGLELRYSEPVIRFRELLHSGAIGQVAHGNCIDSIGRDTMGYTYFLRDYRWLKYSHGLFMQKGIHSIDLINHFVDSAPRRIFASGRKVYFGRDQAKAGKFCRDCEEIDTCRHSAWRRWSREHGYPPRDDHAPDHCAYGTDTDVEDDTSVIAEYGNGARVTFAEIYFAPVYQREFHFWGTEGRASLIVQQKPKNFARIEIQTHTDDSPHVEEVGMTPGSHWGADELMRDRMIEAMKRGETIEPGPLAGRHATAFAQAATESIHSCLPVDIPPADGI